MRKAFIIVIVAVMLTSMFACSNSKEPNSPTEPASTQGNVTSTPNESSQPDTPPPEEEGPYKFAAGKYETMEFPLKVKETLGVNIEYNVVTFANASENFSTRIASDDLCDLTYCAHWYYPGSKLEAIDDGFFVNLYDYKEYMPNYYKAIHMYPEDENILGQIMQRDGTIPAFYALYYDPMRLNGPAVRGDWLDAVGLTQKDIVTVDQYADMLRLFKTEIGCPSPYLLLSGFDAHAIFACYDTHAYARAKCIRDGKVSFAFTSEQDKKYMTTINQWWNEDLILKDYLSISANPQGLSWITTGQVGALGMIPSEKLDFEKGSDDPNMNWVPLANPVVYEGQTIHLALGINKLADGSWWLSTKCDNIPLLMTYCDYFYSEDGMILGNYGVEGYTYNYDENGEIKFADWLVNHDAGFSNALHIFCQSELVEGGYKFRSRSYAFDGGEKLKSFIDFWEDEEFYRYDASMVYPPAIVLTDEQSADYVVFSTDVQTYMNETLPLFVDGSKPLAEWDSYVAQMREIGLNECEQIYQEAYDAYMAAN